MNRALDEIVKIVLVIVMVGMSGFVAWSEYHRGIVMGQISIITPMCKAPAHLEFVPQYKRRSKSPALRK